MTLSKAYRFATRAPHACGLDYVGRVTLEEAVRRCKRRRWK